MIYLSELKRSIGFVFVLVFTVVIMIGFSAGYVKAKTFNPIFDPDNFPDPPVINNPFMTLTPVTAFCYEGETEDGTETDEVTVTDCELEIADVQVVVVRDAVYLDGELVEDTYDYYAQDEDGHIWYLGEASKECDSGETEGSWITGEDDAEAGIVMLNNPMPGISYMQEFLEGEAEDMAKVLRLNANVTESCDKDCLETKEWTELAHGEIEHKFYSLDMLGSGIGGLVLVEELKGKTVMSELVEIVENADSGGCPTDDLEETLDSLCNEDNPPPMNCDNEE